MATNSIAGYKARVYVSVDGGGTYPEVLELKDVTLTIQTDVLDATSHSSNGWKENKAGNKSWSAKAGALMVQADPGQLAAINAALAGNTCKFRFDPEGTTVTLARYTGDGIFSNVEFSGPQSDLAGASFEITGSGPLVKAAQ